MGERDSIFMTWESVSNLEYFFEDGIIKLTNYEQEEAAVRWLKNDSAIQTFPRNPIPL